jgi:hypothetical protein
VKQAYDKGENKTNYPNSSIGQQFRLMSKLISGGLGTRVYMGYMTGFDTHVQQQNEDNTGLHPRLLADLSAGVTAFLDDAIEQGFADRVVGMTVSEFGRRASENGSRGTDHGAASVQFVFGTRVRGGVYGNNPDLQNLNRGDVTYEYDYRRVYTDILQTWFSATPEESTAVLGESVAPLSVLQRPVSVQEELSFLQLEQSTVLAPLPSRGQSTLSFTLSQPTHLAITLYDFHGRKLMTITSQTFTQGVQSVPIAYSYPGRYFITLATKKKTLTKEWIVL